MVVCRGTARNASLKRHSATSLEDFNKFLNIIPNQNNVNYLNSDLI